MWPDSTHLNKGHLELHTDIIKLCHVASIFIHVCVFGKYIGLVSTVSRHRQAPSAGGGANERRYCCYIWTGLWSRQEWYGHDCRPHWILQHHWVRVLSFWRCLFAIGSDAILHLDLERLTMPLDQWFLSVFWQGKAFLPCKFKGQFKILVHKKVHKISILFRQYLWQSRNHVLCETGLKGVRFRTNTLLKIQCIV